MRKKYRPIDGSFAENNRKVSSTKRKNKENVQFVFYSLLTLSKQEIVFYFFLNVFFCRMIYFLD